MQKTKWDGAEKPTNTITYKIDYRNFEYAFKRMDRPKPTTVFHINRISQKYYLATSVIEDSYGPPTEICAKLEKNGTRLPN